MKRREKREEFTTSIRGEEEVLVVLKEQAKKLEEHGLIEWDEEERCYYAKEALEKLVKML